MRSIIVYAPARKEYPWNISLTLGVLHGSWYIYSIIILVFPEALNIWSSLLISTETTHPVAREAGLDLIPTQRKYLSM